LATALAKTSRDSWGETDLAGLRRGQPARRDPADTPGPVYVLTAVTIVPAPDAKTEPKAEPKTDGDAAKKPEGRLVVLGTSTFASNQGLGFRATRSLPQHRFLAGQGGEIAIRRRTRAELDLLTSAQSRASCGSMVILPGAVMVCGIWLVVRRRASTSRPAMSWSLTILASSPRPVASSSQTATADEAREDGRRQGTALDHRAQGRRRPDHQAQGRHDQAQARGRRLGDA
jgi:hypothetical protein